MNKQSPFISIIMNCHNGEKYLNEAIDSVLKQTYINYEVIFFDNNSSDKSKEIFMKYKHLRLKYFFSSQTLPLYEARKKAIDHSKGDIFAFLDVDDIWKPTKLEIQIETFKDVNIGLSCTNYFLLNERKNLIKKSFEKKIPDGFILNEALKINYVGMSTLMISRKAYESLEYGFDKKFEIIGDYDLVLRLLVKWKLASIQEPLSYYRWHGNNLSIKKLNLNADELIYWVNCMKSKSDFSSKKNFKYLESHAYGLKGLSLILSNERLKAIKYLFLINNVHLLIKLLLFLSAPKFLISMIRS